MRSDGFDLFTFKPQDSLMAGKDGVVTFVKTYWTAQITRTERSLKHDIILRRTDSEKGTYGQDLSCL